MNFKQKSGLAPQAKVTNGQWTGHKVAGAGDQSGTINSVALGAGFIYSKPLKHLKNRACERSTKLHAKSASKLYKTCVECSQKRSVVNKRITRTADSQNALSRAKAVVLQGASA